MTSKKARAKMVEDYAASRGASIISRKYGVSRKTVYHLDAKMQTVGRKPAFNRTALKQLKELILSRPDITP